MTCSAGSGLQEPVLAPCRVGDYRILYEIHDQVLLVIVVDIGHRREIYR
jgi:mRNA-degrading endonuclease RelE of RelBE toxin-antitoxin system